ncbi:TonB-dependent receptor [Brevundimonas sp. 2R-24]|uniref:TonB-dependent receptor n=1 Tax=Peiella sedimenti TaxID=3061083 RepID=A0ABT8SLN4_9CAUL|nr:TonB-dependent receptor [Caulobacteraceae bacterium XZ-24]
MFIRKLAYGASAAVLMLATASAVHAQETTGAIRGQVTDEGGAPVANATVTVTHEPTGTTSTTMTDANGFYSARGLRVGGPYVVSAATQTGQDSARIGAIGVGDASNVDLILFSSSATAVEEVVVTASRGAPNAFGEGPSSNFGARQIQSLPSISRDLKDVARLDPFAVVNDPDNQDSLSFGGVNTRFNQLTVDGIRQSDDFGLNNNGYPTQRSPISLDALQAINVSAAPFSVINNGFIGGAINAVTRSGTNEFHGAAFYEYTSDDWRGDQYYGWDNRSGSPTRGQRATIAVNAPFEETTWGVSLGGPIIRDTLFFFLNYEKFESTFVLDDTPAGGGGSTEIPRITAGAIDTFRATTQSVYGYDPGSWVNGAPPVADEKMLARVDWNITDDHRLALTFQETIGNSFNGSVSSSFASGNSVTQPRIGLESLQYNKDERLTQYSAQLNSDWTSNFSTELRFGYKETETTQIPLGGLEVGQTQVTVNDLPGVLAGPGSAQIRFGADSFRNDNYLYVETTNAEAIGRWDLGAHSLLFGARTEMLDILNVFVSNSFGEYTFSSYANFQNRIASGYFLRGAVDPNGGTVAATPGTARDGAARFDYVVNTLYGEDSWRIQDDLTLLFGLRYDWFVMDDQPTLNNNFVSRHGFANTANLDGRSILLPRLSLSYTPGDWNFTAGVGRFSTQGLNVWISNPFANDGVRQVTAVCPAGPYTNVDLRAAPAGCTFTPGNGDVNLLDPNFKIPSAWKFNLSVGRDFDLSDWGLGTDWRVQGDILLTRFENSLYWTDLRAQQIGTAPDGRPVYARSTTGVTGANQADMMLTNAEDGGSSNAYALTVAKDWNEGLFDGLSARVTYTYTDATDRNPMTSSIATSSYTRFASSNHNDPAIATSDYEIPHRLAVNVNWTRELFGDNETSINLFAQRRSGLPFSYTFHSSRSGNFDNDFGQYASSYSGIQATSSSLLYVPATDASGNVTAGSDARVTYAGGFDVSAFNDFLHNTGLIDYAGGIAPRNAFRTDDVFTVDLRFSQEIPAFFPTYAKLRLYLDIENFGNLLNDEWGVLEQYTFYRGVPVVQVQCGAGGAGACAAPGATYTYSNLQTAFGTPDEAIRPFGVNNASLWQVKFGIRYSF